MSYVEIIYQNERLIVPRENLEGYKPHEVLCEHETLPEDNLAGMASEEHVRKMHTLKVLEAGMILSGVPLSKGVLVEEAKALSIDLTDLANAVMSKAEQESKFEVARRVQRVSAEPPK